jgi:hypothetical protein
MLKCIPTLGWVRGGAVVGALALALMLPIAASANVADSANWAGYAVHGKGQQFRRVVGSWQIPTGSCQPGQSTYSATWVGIGGYSPSSNALEQIGTELDCTATGQAVATAWTELVPAPSVTLPMAVSQGDAMMASVTVRGHTVTLALTDATSGQSFSHTYADPTVDVSSAEWIVEAPSECSSATDCWTLPLADFGSTQIGMAQVWNTKGHRGGIFNRRWITTELNLTPQNAPRPPAGTTGAIGTASPSRVSADGSVFSVLFSLVSGVTHALRSTAPLVRSFMR